MYIVIELQTFTDGNIGNFTFAYADRLQAESKMHSLLAVAATSALPRHAVVLLDNSGTRLDGGCYIHVEPEPETEPEVEPDE